MVAGVAARPAARMRLLPPHEVTIESPSWLAGSCSSGCESASSGREPTTTWRWPRPEMPPHTPGVVDLAELHTVSPVAAEIDERHSAIVGRQIKPIAASIL